MGGLKRPCSDCPFLRGSDFEDSMCEERAREIADSLESGAEFMCHKTTKAGGAKSGMTKFCAGALATMENEGTVMQNQMVRINGRLGLIEDPATLGGLEECYESLDEWVSAHRSINEKRKT